MRIGIDATALPAQLYGVGNYIFHLSRALLQVNTANAYVIFAKPLHASLFTGPACAQVVPVPLPSRLLRIAWEQIRLPGLARQYGLDVLHSPHYTIPFWTDCATVATFHDMTFFLYPQLHQSYKQVFFKTSIRLSARRANAIIADSENTRQDILRILNPKPQRIFAIPLGVSNDFRPMDDAVGIERTRHKYHLPQHIILYLGVLEPRKNLTMLVRAFKTLVERGINHSLVVVGKKGWMYEEIFQTVNDLVLQERVIFTGYFPETDLPFLYNAADLFVYPSLYEGFGLPVLEAMACGVPVITSNTSSMPEITGDASLLVNPQSVDDWADAMQRVLTDRTLHAKLARRGLARSKLFSWERTARETLAVYEHVV